MLLDCALQGPRAELRIVSFLGEKTPCAGIQFQRQVLLRKPLLQTRELDVHNRVQLLLGKAVKDDNIVNAVEELGPEEAAQFDFHALLHFNLVFRAQFPGVEIFLNNR